MSAPVYAFRVKTAGHARCEDCDQLHAAATRERVRQHVASSGHTAHVTIEDITTYQPKEPS